MKSRNVIFIILCVVILLLMAFLIWAQFVTRNPSPIPNEMLDHKGYKVALITYTSDNLKYEAYCIVDVKNKVIDTRQRVIGYNEEELNRLNKEYAEGPSNVYYNVTVKDNALVYNVTWYNGKGIDTVISNFKNNKTITDLHVVEL